MAVYIKMSDCDKKKDFEYFSTGEVCRRYGLSLKTLRYYDKVGILKPTIRDHQTGYRYYEESIILRLGSIKYYQSMGLSLDDIRKFLYSENLEELIENFKSDLSNRQRKIDLEIMRRDAMKVWLDLLVEGKTILAKKDYPIGLRKIPEIKAAYSYNQDSFLLDNYDSYNILYDAIYVEYPNLKKRINGETQSYLRYMAIHPLNYCNFRTTVFGGFWAVSGIHIGSRKSIGKTYKKIMKWAEDNDTAMKNTSLERYIIDETSVNREEEFVTEILIPIED